MYIDESGDTAPISQKGKNFLVLTGCILEDSKKMEIESKFRAIKNKYYQNPEIEIKSNFLRYANPDLEENSPLKLMDRSKYDQLESEITDFLKEIPINIFSIVIHKSGYWAKYPSQNPYFAAYIFLLERFQMYLKEHDDSFGIVIIDPREGQVEKHFIGKELEEVHSKLRWNSDGFWSNCPNIIEKVLFSSSDRTVGIQVADLYCYPVFHIFEYDKKKEDYWRFNDVTFPKLCRKGRRVNGIGLKFFPEESKKGLNYFIQPSS